MIKSIYYLAKVCFLLGDSDKAILLAQPISEKYQDANILMAEVIIICFLIKKSFFAFFNVEDNYLDLSFQKRFENIN
jgi:hypothetical protein